MQFNQGNSTDNGVIVSANPNKYKIESIEFTFASGSRDNALTLYASNKAFNAVEETSEVLISDNIKKAQITRLQFHLPKRTIAISA